METIEGSIARVVYYNKDNGYTVASMNVKINPSDITNLKKRIITDTLTIVGVFDRLIVEDEAFELTGDFVKDPKFGLQFRFKSFKRLDFTSKNGVVSFLSSELFPGIGVKTAKQVVEKLGLDAIEKIKRDPKVLDLVKLSTEEKDTITKGICESNSSQELIVFLLDHGITIEMAHKIDKALKGKEAIQLIKENPYALIDKVERFGFKKADALAENLGIKKSAPCRLKALLVYGLNEVLYSTGNSYISKGELYVALIRYIGEEIPKIDYENSLNALETEHKIYIDPTGNIYDYKNYSLEIELAKEIASFLKDERSKNGLPKYTNAAILKAFEKIKEESLIEFSKEQARAIQEAFTVPLMIVTGGPGTGKTTIVKAIIRMYLLLNGDSSTISESIQLLAPTGRAAKRMKEATNMPNAQTIHRFLGYSGEGFFEHDKNNRTSAKLIIVDEASMMDLPLASRLITSMDDEARIIIVGDVDQLPSVGPGQVLKDLIETNLIKTVRLNVIHRQAEDSSIVSLAHAINNGQLPNNLMNKLSDRNFINTSNELLPSLLCDLYMKAIEKGKSVRDIQILIPMYKGDCGITEINTRIQERINPKKDENEIKHYNNVFRINDKVIQLVNRPEKNIMNGDIGYVSSFIYKADKITGLIVSFDVLNVPYEIEELDDLTLAYAVSVHKAQGSEFDLVILPFSTAYFIMLKRKLIYTAITRAKKTLIMIGNPQALATGISRLELNRQTILRSKIIEFFNKKDLSELIKQIPSNYQDKQIIDMEEETFLGEEEITL